MKNIDEVMNFERSADYIRLMSKVRFALQEAEFEIKAKRSYKKANEMVNCVYNTIMNLDYSVLSDSEKTNIYKEIKHILGFRYNLTVWQKEGPDGFIEYRKKYSIDDYIGKFYENLYNEFIWNFKV